MGEADKLFTDGQAYERLMGRWSRKVGKLFLDWLDAPKNLSWLDVGCGNGAFTEEIIARCTPAAVTAIDPSDDQLAYAPTRPCRSWQRSEHSQTRKSAGSHCGGYQNLLPSYSQSVFTRPRPI
jgi:2-polyprenyl-3-methyl-5-hydroxy-6-metoxy-1,4-benzoquinol methylase